MDLNSTDLRVELLTEQSDTEQIDNIGSAPSQVKVDVSTLTTIDNVKKESLQFYKTKDSKYLIHVLIQFPTPSKKKVKLFVYEPVIFVYGNNSLNNVPEIYSERKDFPRNLPHLNPVFETSPASFCIAREGTQNLYDIGGIASVVKRLAGWLHDASAGLLDADGWEPYPRARSLLALFKVNYF